jgi:hypothetical protein
MMDIYSNPGSYDSLEKQEFLPQIPGKFLILEAHAPAFTLAIISDELVQQMI